MYRERLILNFYVGLWPKITTNGYQKLEALLIEIIVLTLYTWIKKVIQYYYLKIKICIKFYHYLFIRN